MHRAINPGSIRAPFATYSHGILVEAPARLLVMSGQLGVSVDDRWPESAADQAALCFGNIDAILDEAGLGRRHVLRLNAYVSAREHLTGYMQARDAWIAGIDPPPASTLMIVGGFTRPEFKVEIEALAAG